MKHGTLRSDYRKSGSIKMAGGYGGFYCPCCNAYRCSPRNCKHLVRRRMRRTSKHNLQCTLANGEVGGQETSN